MLTYCVGTHWHALVSDILHIGKQVSDMFTPRLTLGELVSLVMAPRPNSALKDALQGGWSKTDHLLANMQEANAGLSTLPERYERPDDGGDRKTPATSLFPADVMSWDDYTKAEKERYAAAERERT